MPPHDDQPQQEQRTGSPVAVVIVIAVVVALIGTGPMLAAAGPLLLLGMLAGPAADSTTDTSDTTGCGNLPAVKALTAQQTRAAQTLFRAAIQIASRDGWKPADQQKAAVIVLATAMQESSLGAAKGWDRPNQDGDAGWFQQRTLPGWYGSLAEVTNPARATEVFLLGHTVSDTAVQKARAAGTTPAGPAGYQIPGLKQIDDWQRLSIAEAAQAVQRSAHPGRYATRAPLARQLAASFGGTTGCTNDAANPDGPLHCGKPTLPLPEHLATLVGLTPDAQRVLRCAHGQFPSITQWLGVGERPSTVDRDHQEGRALDAMIPQWQTDAGRGTGDELAAWVIKNRTQLGLKYVIWRARIWSTSRADEGWRVCGQTGGCYNGPDDTLAHRDHVHISVRGNAGHTRTGDTVRLPVDSYTLTGRFGQCGAHWKNCHTGLDFAAPTGTPIHAIADGTVLYAGPGGADKGGAYGRFTRIDHDGTHAWYAHQHRITVAAGDRVRAGQVIGSVGATGNVTGPHLHLEIHPDAGLATNPYTWLASHGARP